MKHIWRIERTLQGVVCLQMLLAQSDIHEKWLLDVPDIHRPRYPMTWKRNSGKYLNTRVHFHSGL